MNLVTCCIYCGHIVDVNSKGMMLLHHDRNNKQCYGGRQYATGTIAQKSSPPLGTAANIKVNVKNGS